MQSYDFSLVECESQKERKKENYRRRRSAAGAISKVLKRMTALNTLVCGVFLRTGRSWEVFGRGFSVLDGLKGDFPFPLTCFRGDRMEDLDGGTVRQTAGQRETRRVPPQEEPNAPIRRRVAAVSCPALSAARLAIPGVMDAEGRVDESRLRMHICKNGPTDA